MAKGRRHGAGRNVGRRGRDELSESLDRAGRIIPHRLGSRTRGTPCRRAFAPTEHLADASPSTASPLISAGRAWVCRRPGPGGAAGRRCWPSPASRRGPRTRTSSPRRHGCPSRRPRRSRRRRHNRGRWWHAIQSELSFYELESLAKGKFRWIILPGYEAAKDCLLAAIRPRNARGRRGPRNARGRWELAECSIRFLEMNDSKTDLRTMLV